MAIGAGFAAVALAVFLDRVVNIDDADAIGTGAFLLCDSDHGLSFLAVVVMCVGKEMVAHDHEHAAHAGVIQRVKHLFPAPF